MRDQVQLIAYADRLGGSLRGLREVLDGPLAGAFGGVHVLPFYLPYDGADAGFDPDDHLAVDPRLGTWDDLAALARGRRRHRRPDREPRLRPVRGVPRSTASRACS